MNRGGLEMLASVLVAILCQQQAHTLDIVKTSLWRASGNGISPKTSQIPEMSRFQCASLCLTNIICRRFCHNIVTRTCHVDDVMSSQGLVSPEGSNCFYKITECADSDGYNLHDSRCLKLHTTPATFSSAREECSVEGGHLYYFKVLALDQPPLASLTPHNLTVWVGADAIGKGGEFSWHDGTLLLHASELWDSNQPSTNIYGDEECVSITNYRASVSRCSVLFQFVCETDL